MHWTPQLPTSLNSSTADWLTHTGSMTKRLQETAQSRFDVHIINERWVTPDQLAENERILLHLSTHEKVKLREVHLMVDGEPWIYGYTLFPETTLNDEKTHLQELGTKPLGQILFSDPSTVRHPMSFCCLTHDEPLYQQAIHGLPKTTTPLWSRRSLFTIQSRLLLLYEVFLPGLIATPPH